MTTLFVLYITNLYEYLYECLSPFLDFREVTWLSWIYK